MTFPVTRLWLFIWRNCLLVIALDYQSRGLAFETTGWLQGGLSLSSFRGVDQMSTRTFPGLNSKSKLYPHSGFSLETVEEPHP